MTEETRTPRVAHHNRHPWLQPGDRPDRVWMLRFDDNDVRDMVWIHEDAEEEARKAYAQYSPAWNCYLFATLPAVDPLSATPPPTGEGWRPSREEIARASRAARQNMRDQGFSGGWDHDDLVNAIVAALFPPAKER